MRPAKGEVSFTKRSAQVRKRYLWLGVSLIAALVLCVGCPNRGGGSSGPPSAASAPVTVTIKGGDCPVRDIVLKSISVTNDHTSGHRYLKYSVKVVCHIDSGDKDVDGATLTISVPGYPFSKDIGPSGKDGAISGDTLNSIGLDGLPDTFGQGGEKVDVTVVGDNGTKYSVQLVTVDYVK